jgi:hypothetical protein
VWKKEYSAIRWELISLTRHLQGINLLPIYSLVHGILSLKNRWIFCITSRALRVVLVVVLVPVSVISGSHIEATSCFCCYKGYYLVLPSTSLTLLQKYSEYMLLEVWAKCFLILRLSHIITSFVYVVDVLRPKVKDWTNHPSTTGTPNSRDMRAGL